MRAIRKVKSRSAEIGRRVVVLVDCLYKGAAYVVQYPYVGHRGAVGGEVFGIVPLPVALGVERDSGRIGCRLVVLFLTRDTEQHCGCKE